MSTRRIISREKTTHLPQISRGELLFTPTLVSELSGILPLIGVNRIDIRFSEKKIERTGQHFTIVKKRVEPISNDRQVLETLGEEHELEILLVDHHCNIISLIHLFSFIYLLSILFCFCLIRSFFFKFIAIYRRISLISVLTDNFVKSLSITIDRLHRYKTYSFVYPCDLCAWYLCEISLTMERN